MEGIAMAFSEDRYKAFAIWLAISSLTIAIAYQSSLSLAILTAVFFLLALLVVHPLWLSANTNYARVRLACVSLLSICASYYLAPQYIAALVNGAMILVNERFTWHLPLLDTSTPPSWVLVIVIAAISVVLHSLPDRLIMPKAESSADKPNDDTFDDDLRAFAELWQHRLSVIDRETNWSNRDFVPLDAEVETHSLDRNDRGVRDLIRALQFDSTNAPILILGEPGSGKSIALRRLCRELLRETHSSKRLPLYVNLKNWTASARWNEANPPTTAQLRDYVHSYIHREADDLFADRFLRRNFDNLLRQGTFFFHT
jgi:hypothetical protein